MSINTEIEIKTMALTDSGFIELKQLDAVEEDSIDIDGVILLKIGDKWIIEEKYWDAIDWLWPSIMNGISEDLIHGNNTKIVFAESPNTINISQIKRFSIVKVIFCQGTERERSAVVDYKTFVTKLITEWEIVLTKFYQLRPNEYNGKYDYLWDQIKTVKEHLKTIK